MTQKLSSLEAENHGQSQSSAAEGDDWTALLEQLAGNLQAVTDKRVVEDMDDEERRAYESLISAYKNRTR